MKNNPSKIDDIIENEIFLYHLEKLVLKYNDLVKKMNKTSPNDDKISELELFWDRFEA